MYVGMNLCFCAGRADFWPVEYVVLGGFPHIDLRCEKLRVTLSFYQAKGVVSVMHMFGISARKLCAGARRVCMRVYELEAV